MSGALIVPGCSMTECPNIAHIKCPKCEHDWCDEHSDGDYCIYCTPNAKFSKEKIQHQKDMIEKYGRESK